MSVPISGKLARVNPAGPKYPLFDPNDGEGGLKLVADITARDAIDSLQRLNGMLAYVMSEDKVYRLQPDLSEWRETQFSMPSIKTVADNTARDAIPAHLRQSGMLVWVRSGSRFYRLEANLTTWTEQTFAATSRDIRTFNSVSEMTTFLGSVAQVDVPSLIFVAAYHSAAPAGTHASSNAWRDVGGGFYVYRPNSTRNVSRYVFALANATGRIEPLFSDGQIDITRGGAVPGNVSDSGGNSDVILDDYWAYNDPAVQAATAMAQDQTWHGGRKLYIPSGQFPIQTSVIQVPEFSRSVTGVSKSGSGSLWTVTLTLSSAPPAGFYPGATVRLSNLDSWLNGSRYISSVSGSQVAIQFFGSDPGTVSDTAGDLDYTESRLIVEGVSRTASTLRYVRWDGGSTLRMDDVTGGRHVFQPSGQEGRISNVNATWKSFQYSDRPGSVAILVPAESDGPARWTLENIAVRRSAYGILYAAGSGQRAWNASWRHIYIIDASVQGVGIYRGGTVTTVENLYVQNASFPQTGSNTRTIQSISRSGRRITAVLTGTALTGLTTGSYCYMNSVEKAPFVFNVSNAVKTGSGPWTVELTLTGTPTVGFAVGASITLAGFAGGNSWLNGTRTVTAWSGTSVSVQFTGSDPGSLTGTPTGTMTYTPSGSNPYTTGTQFVIQSLSGDTVTMDLNADTGINPLVTGSSTLSKNNSSTSSLPQVHLSQGTEWDCKGLDIETGRRPATTDAVVALNNEGLCNVGYLHIEYPAFTANNQTLVRNNGNLTITQAYITNVDLAPGATGYIFTNDGSGGKTQAVLKVGNLTMRDVANVGGSLIVSRAIGTGTRPVQIDTTVEDTTVRANAKSKWPFGDGTSSAIVSAAWINRITNPVSFPELLTSHEGRYSGANSASFKEGSSRFIVDVLRPIQGIRFGVPRFVRPDTFVTPTENRTVSIAVTNVVKTGSGPYTVTLTLASTPDSLEFGVGKNIVLRSLDSFLNGNQTVTAWAGSTAVELTFASDPGSITDTSGTIQYVPANPYEVKMSITRVSSDLRTIIGVPIMLTWDGGSRYFKRVDPTGGYTFTDMHWEPFEAGTRLLVTAYFNAKKSNTTWVVTNGIAELGTITADQPHMVRTSGIGKSIHYPYIGTRFNSNGNVMDPVGYDHTAGGTMSPNNPDGFVAPIVEGYALDDGRTAATVPAIVWLGDSISQGTGDAGLFWEALGASRGFVGRAFIGQRPLFNLSVGGNAAQYWYGDYAYNWALRGRGAYSGHNGIFGIALLTNDMLEVGLTAAQGIDRLKQVIAKARLSGAKKVVTVSAFYRWQTTDCYQTTTNQTVPSGVRADYNTVVGEVNQILRDNLGNVSGGFADEHIDLDPILLEPGTNKYRVAELVASYTASTGSTQGVTTTTQPITSAVTAVSKTDLGNGTWRVDVTLSTNLVGAAAGTPVYFANLNQGIERGKVLSAYAFPTASFISVGDPGSVADQTGNMHIDYGDLVLLNEASGEWRRLSTTPNGTLATDNFTAAATNGNSLKLFRIYTHDNVHPSSWIHGIIAAHIRESHMSKFVY